MRGVIRLNDPTSHGGKVVGAAPPRELAKVKNSATAPYLQAFFIQEKGCKTLRGQTT